jgi:nuclear transport factor 2 (NTF2) superfamily protein
MSRPPLPPFTAETSAQKARMAEDAWNSRDPAKVALAYTTDSRWRNRAEFLQGREAIEAFLTRKWNRELDYRLIKQVWAFHDNRIAVRFAYEWHDDSGHWFRSYGNDNWEFDEQGLMRLRIASINDLPSTQASASITGRSAAARTTTRRSASSGYSGDENLQTFPRTGNVSNTTVRFWMRSSRSKSKIKTISFLNSVPSALFHSSKNRTAAVAGLSAQWKIVLTVSLSADVFANKV